MIDEQKIKEIVYMASQATKSENSGLVQTLETVKVKMHAKLKAIDMINRMLGYNEQEDIEGTSFTINFKKKVSE